MLRALACSLVLAAAAPATAQSPVLSSCSEAEIRAAASPEGLVFIDRALDWVHRGVMYCQCVTGASTPYRADCSGLVSLAWALPADAPWGGNTTYHFNGGEWDNGRSKLISWDEIAIGDAVNYPGVVANGTGHIRLFAGWRNAEHTRYCAIEEYSTGTPARIAEHSVTSSYRPIRLASWAGPSCDRTAANLTFSCDGPHEGATCISVDEPDDPDTWVDNYLCTPTDEGIRWSASGPIEGMHCTNVTEGIGPNAASWSDNHLCWPQQSPFELTWSSAGAVEGWSCVQFNEPSDLDTWSDNFLCTRPVYRFGDDDWMFSSAGPVDGMHCVSVDEPGDPDTWIDNYFCSREDIGMEWSYAGPIEGMTCTGVVEPSDVQAEAWVDNHLCLPQGSRYELAWSAAGPIEGATCVRWYEGVDLAGTWGDNYLCISLAPVPEPDAGPGPSDAGPSSVGSNDPGGESGRVAALTGACAVSRAGAGSRPPVLVGVSLLALAVVLARPRRR